MAKKSIIAGSIMTLGLAGMFGASNVSAATNLDGDLTLNQDVEKCYVLESGSVTLNLNGHNITCDNDDAIRVENGATLTVKGEGKVVTTANESAAIYTNIGGTAIIENGDYRSVKWYTIKNLGTMIVNGGFFHQGDGNSANASLVDNGWYNAGSTTGAADQGNAWSDGLVATLTINGGTFNHITTTSTIKSDDASKSIINDGVFKSENGYLVQASGEAIINGGNFTGYSSMITLYGDSSVVDLGKATINGGEVSAKYIAVANGSSSFGGGNITINGGNFKNLTSIFDPDKKYLIKSASIAGGTYNVTPEDYLTSGYGIFVNDDAFTVEKTAKNLPENYTTETIVTEIEPEEQSAIDSLNISGLTTAATYDINVLDENGAPVSELDDAATFTLPLPTNLPALADGYTRDFYVIRIHEGEAKILTDAVVNADGTISFSSDLFSTYVISYADTKTTTETPKAPNTGVSTKESSSTTASFVAYLASGIVAALALFALKNYKKR